MIKIESLAAIPFFADFSAEELNGVATMMTERVYQPGEIIFLEGQAADGLFFVASGRVRVFKTSPSGKEQALCLMTPRTCFGGCPIFDGNTRPSPRKPSTKWWPICCREKLTRSSGRGTTRLCRARSCISSPGA